MVRGKKTNDPKLSQGRALSGHLDEWMELAVDYLDGHLDPSTEAAMQAHLDGCPECARRLAAQQAALAAVKRIPLAEAPAGLEARVLEKVLQAGESSGGARRPTQRRPVRRPRALLSPAGPWLPALAGAAAAVALVLALTLTHSSGPLTGTSTTALEVFSSGAGSAQTLRDDGASLPSTTNTVLLGSTGPVKSTEAAATLTTPRYAGPTDLQPTGPYLQDREAMVNGLTQASAPAYLFFAAKDGGPVTAAQAGTVASQVTSATGLQLMDQNLSSGVTAFAAYVPREDAAAVVDLLRSIGDSLQLSVCLSLEPGTQVTTWADSMLQDKYSLAELSASPSRPPATSGWLYTTSTSPPTTAGSSSTSVTMLAQTDTDVLVVIFMAVGS